MGQQTAGAAFTKELNVVKMKHHIELYWGVRNTVCSKKTDFFRSFLEGVSKYEPISDASQVPVDSSLMINFPILVIKQNLNINILIDFLIRTLSFSPIS